MYPHGHPASRSWNSRLEPGHRRSIRGNPDAVIGIGDRGIWCLANSSVRLPISSGNQMTVLTCAHRRGSPEGTALPLLEVLAVKMGDSCRSAEPIGFYGRFQVPCAWNRAWLTRAEFDLKFFYQRTSSRAGRGRQDAAKSSPQESPFTEDTCVRCRLNWSSPCGDEAARRWGGCPARCVSGPESHLRQTSATTPRRA